MAEITAGYLRDLNRKELCKFKETFPGSIDTKVQEILFSAEYHANRKQCFCVDNILFTTRTDQFNYPNNLFLTAVKYRLEALGFKCTIIDNGILSPKLSVAW